MRIYEFYPVILHINRTNPSPSLLLAETLLPMLFVQDLHQNLSSIQSLNVRLFLRIQDHLIQSLAIY